MTKIYNTHHQILVNIGKIFNDKKYVEVYLSKDIKKEIGLEREDLIALAFFLGSDYTEVLL